MIPGASATWLPTQLASLIGWWDATDPTQVTNVGGVCSQLGDKSSLANALTASGAARPSVTGTINSLAGLTYAGSQKLTNAAAAGLPDNSGGYIMCTAMQESTTGGFLLQVGQISASLPGSDTCSLETDSNWLATTNNGSLIAWNAVAVVGTGANILSGFLGSSTSGVFYTGTAGSGGGGGYGHNYTGNAYIALGNGLTGIICETAMCSGIVTSDRQKLEGYMAWKYNLQGALPGGHPYKSAPP
jgi:hypothetical protein